MKTLAQSPKNATIFEWKLSLLIPNPTNEAIKKAIFEAQRKRKSII
jgi:hypothetical protein